uniref:Pro-neuregulin-3, membrane-bound isoform n=1 Tax=Catharus ustulatus TaxID=91951 RepID=A0A8C3TQJ4_CATUS
WKWLRLSSNFHFSPLAVSSSDTTTYSTERSEHFKPCKDKDLAYCLNEGECFVIETLTGSHKHCRCKEGYQGVRCDQFLPKTDSILSDPSTSKVFVLSRRVPEAVPCGMTLCSQTGHCSCVLRAARA